MMESIDFKNGYEQGEIDGIKLMVDLLMEIVANDSINDKLYKILTVTRLQKYNKYS